MTAPLPRVALIEDDEDLRVSTTQLLTLAGFAVDAYPSAAPALAAIQADFTGVVVTDVRLPHMSGTEVFELLRTRDPTLPVILITGHGDVTMAVAALKAGAWDFLTKPFDPDVLLAAVARASTARALELDNRQLRAAAQEDADDGLIGTSPAIERLRAMIPTLADADIDLLIEGETGTGKALLARRIHAAGKRRRHRLLGVACAAYPDALLDTDLFARVGTGSVVAASRGTVLLDDLDHASRGLQARLTALVEARALVTPGARDAIPIDLRIIATAAEEGARAEDAIAPALLYRVAAVRLRMPPLRERREDVVPLFAHFVAQGARRIARPVPPMRRRRSSTGSRRTTGRAMSASLRISPSASCSGSILLAKRRTTARQVSPNGSTRSSARRSLRRWRRPGAKSARRSNSSEYRARPSITGSSGSGSTSARSSAGDSGGVLPDAALAMLEHRGDDQILLVREMPGKQRHQPVGRVGIAVACVLHRCRTARQRRDQIARAVQRADQRGMDQFVVAFKHVEAPLHSRVERAELGEIEAVLDPVVPLEVLEEMVEARDERLLERRCIQHALAEGLHDLLQLPALLAQAGVDLQPECREFAEIVVLPPFRRGIGIAQIGDRVGKSEPIGERPRVGIFSHAPALGHAGRARQLPFSFPQAPALLEK